MVSYVLLGLMVATLVAQLVVTNQSDEGRKLHNDLFVIGPDWLQRPWTLVTSTFAHGDLFHLLLNGLFLFFLGPTVERLVGATRFTTVFLVAGALSGVLQVTVTAWLGNDSGALGASGALMGIFGILMVLLPNERILFWGIVPVKMWVMGVIFAAMDVLGLLGASTEPIGRFAHLSGLAFGLAAGWYFRHDLKRRGLRIVSR